MSSCVFVDIKTTKTSYSHSRYRSPKNVKAKIQICASVALQKNLSVPVHQWKSNIWYDNKPRNKIIKKVKTTTFVQTLKNGFYFFTFFLRQNKSRRRRRAETKVPRSVWIEAPVSQRTNRGVS